jgi:hypothetical protein
MISKENLKSLWIIVLSILLVVTTYCGRELWTSEGAPVLEMKQYGLRVNPSASSGTSLGALASMYNGSSPITFVFDDPVTISDSGVSISIAENIELMFVNDGQLIVPSGVTIDHNGDMIAGWTRHILDVSEGGFFMLQGSMVPEVPLAWYGLKKANTESANQNAVQRALDGGGNTNYKTYVLPPGRADMKPIVIQGQKSLRCARKRGCQWYFDDDIDDTPTGVTAIMTKGGEFNVRLENFDIFLTGDKGAAGIEIRTAGNAEIYSMGVYQTDAGASAYANSKGIVFNAISSSSSGHDIRHSVIDSFRHGLFLTYSPFHNDDSRVTSCRFESNVYEVYGEDVNKNNGWHFESNLFGGSKVDSSWAYQRVHVQDAEGWVLEGNNWEVKNPPGWASSVTEFSCSPIWFGSQTQDVKWIPAKLFPIDSIKDMYTSGNSRMFVTSGRNTIIEGNLEIRAHAVGVVPLDILGDPGQTGRLIDVKHSNPAYSGVSRIWTLDQFGNPIVEEKNYTSSGGILNLDYADTSQFRVILSENINQINLYSTTTPFAGQKFSITWVQTGGSNFTLPALGNWDWINKENGITKNMGFYSPYSGSSGYPPSGVSDNQRMYQQFKYDTGIKWWEIQRANNMYEPP